MHGKRKKVEDAKYEFRTQRARNACRNYKSSDCMRSNLLATKLNADFSAPPLTFLTSTLESIQFARVELAAGRPAGESGRENASALLRCHGKQCVHSVQPRDEYEERGALTAAPVRSSLPWAASRAEIEAVTEPGEKSSWRRGRKSTISKQPLFRRPPSSSK